MTTVGIKNARQNLARLIETAQRGAPITITRRGKQVATLTGIAPAPAPKFPDLAAFRAALKSACRGRCVTVADLRRAERW